MGLRSISIETKWQVVGLNKSDLINREIGRQLEISECIRALEQRSKIVMSLEQSKTKIALVVQKKCQKGAKMKQLYSLDATQT